MVATQAAVDKVSGRELRAEGKLIKAGDIITVSLTKDDNEFITSISRVDLEPARKVGKFGWDRNRREYFVEFEEGTPKLIWISKDADQFGKVEVGKWVQYTEEDRYDVVDLIAVVSAPKEAELPEDAVVFNGIVRLDGNTYIKLDKECIHSLVQYQLMLKQGIQQYQQWKLFVMKSSY